MTIYVILSVLLFYHSIDAQTCIPECSSEQWCSQFGVCIGPYPPSAQWQVWISVTNILEPDFDPGNSDTLNIIRGGPDRRWLHLHRGTLGVEDANVSATIRDGGTLATATFLASYQIRYTILNKPVSPWLSYPFTTLFSMNDGNFDTTFPLDGIFHLSAEIRNSSDLPALNFQPVPCHVHIKRSGFTVFNYTPVGLYEPDPDAGLVRSSYSPYPLYINIFQRKNLGYPMDSNLVPWNTEPHNTDLYAEQMAPRSSLFEPINMWWADPFHDNLPFVRGMPPKHNEEIGALRVESRHERFPARDGPRGVGWMSSYVHGTFDLHGRFIFVEISGRVGYLYPDGEVYTLAGWVTDPTKDPVWIYKPTVTVRQNQILRGTWVNGQHPGESGGFHTPMDVTFDPNDENILYVAGFEDNCIWKVVVNDVATHNVTVSVFAGDILHSSGMTDGVGTAARFFHPVSLVFDSVADVIYVADQDSGRIRKVTRDGTVVTLYGGENVKVQPNIELPYTHPSVWETCGASQWFIQKCAQNAVSLSGGPGHKPAIFLPQTIRTDSFGNIILLDIGFGLIRRINPVDNSTKIFARTFSKLAKWTRGWAWMDVDKWGNSGPKNAIYWCKFVGEIFYARHGPNVGDPGCEYQIWKNIGCDTTTYMCKQNDNANHSCPITKSSNVFSETYGYVPPNNNDEKSYLLRNSDWDIAPRFGGPFSSVDPPHYPWLVAVDPKGSLLLAGGGEHGILRVRQRRNTDPLIEDKSTSWDHWYNYWNGENVFNGGASDFVYGKSRKTPAHGLLGTFGYNGHSLLGLSDPWGLTTSTDDQLFDSFLVENSLRNNSSVKNMLLMYLRSSMGTTDNVTEPNVEVYTPGRPPPLYNKLNNTIPVLEPVELPPNEENSNANPTQNSGNEGVVIGVVIGVLIIIIVAAVIVFFLWKKKKGSFEF